MADEDELRLRHLADVQATIARMSQHSFVIRGWSVTLVSIVFTVLGTQGRNLRLLAVVALAPAVIFWGLDAYYLRQERLFRRLHAAVARRLLDGAEAPDVRPLDMGVAEYQDEVPGFWRTLVAPHVLAIPATLIVLTLGYTLLLD
ncbi:hypothetical protein V1634_02305 [Plantactinospora veratri]|uniref:Uncharacterized protein n=1 Tax=Plantactinospora veratri TaxID=1436122 RepID=A0ABU7S732_9ACTN